jgi:hypothetical protein
MCTWRSNIDGVRRGALRFAALVLAAAGGLAAADVPARRAVLEVDCPYPTADKPQSKLWHDGGTWWALLPRATGPSLWERTAAGWREHTGVTEKLRGVPARADVWSDRDGATAVTVADRLMAIVRLRRPASGGAAWEAEVSARLAAPVSDSFETATIARDGDGRWWVAAPVSGRVFVWTSSDGRTWAPPTQLAGGLHVDDLCLVTPLPGGVAVVWSDQKSDAVRLRVHRTGAPEAEWQQPVTVAEGGGTADDHLDAAVEADGTLWLATKNSVDGPGRPQLVLRVRDPQGTWHNYDYAPLSDAEAPSRPTVIATATPGDVRLGHVVYGNGPAQRDRIVFGRADPAQPEILVGARTVIAPEDPAARVNDITGPKAVFPAAGPWLVLASDAQGRVYEADLNAGFGK